MKRVPIIVIVCAALAIAGCSAGESPRPVTVRPAWEKSAGAVASIPALALVPVSSFPATLPLTPGSLVGGKRRPLLKGSDLVTVEWADGGDNSTATLTLDFATDGMGVLRDWTTANPQGRLVVVLSGRVVTVLQLSEPILDGSITLSGVDLVKSRHVIEAATQPSGFAHGRVGQPNKGIEQNATR